MGAFLLHERGRPVDEAALARAFADRGFTRVTTLELGSAVLHLARKSHLDLPNLVTRALPGGGHATLAVTGSPVYDGLPWQPALERLLEDLLENRLRTDRLAGACCLVFHDPSRDARPRVIGDPSGLYHLFQDGEGRVLSSSQLLSLAALPGPWPLDRAAVLDLLTAGYLVAPRTLFRTLRLATTACPPRPVPWLEFQAPLAPMEPVSVIRGGLPEHLEFQLANLREHLALCRGLMESLGVDMGLSGGYDSRLLVLLAREFESPFSTHTHVKEGDHRDRLVARQLASRLGLPLAELATTAPSAMEPEELEQVLASSYRFYDGHAVEMMNLLKHEYTPDYRVRALAGKGINLSGVGGEIYRNYNYTRPAGRMEARAWVAYHVINHHNLACLTHEAARRALVERQTRAILRALDLEGADSLDFRQTRRYYGEVWLSSWHGVRNSVESSLALYLTPFSDRRVLRAALASSARIGVHGAFEAALIERLDHTIAAIPSNYGFPFTAIPARARLAAGLRAWLPNGLKLALARRVAKTSGTRAPADALLARHPVLVRSLAALAALELPIDWNRYLAGSSTRILAFSLGYILQRLEGVYTVQHDPGEPLQEEPAR